MVDYENLKVVDNKPRAPIGGCIGKNGEIYVGGQFLPESEYSIKGQYKKDQKGRYTVSYYITENKFDSFSGKYVNRKVCATRKFFTIEETETFANKVSGVIIK